MYVVTQVGRYHATPTYYQQCPTVVLGRTSECGRYVVE